MYCCEHKCIQRPSVEVDGWYECGCANYCKCKCITYYKNKYNEYKIYENRLKTFQTLSYINHPFCVINKYDLAKSGFYYIGGIDRVKCFKSRCVIIYNWKENDKPNEVHNKLCDCNEIIL